MNENRALSDFRMSRQSPVTDARDFMAAFDRRYSGLFQAAEQAFTDANRRRQLIFWIGSGVIVAALALLWWTNAQGVTNISPWLIVGAYAAFWGFNKWRKTASQQAFRDRFTRAGVTDDEFRNLCHATSLVGYSGVMMIAFSEMGAAADFHGGAGADGGGDIGGGGCGGCGG